MPAGATFPVLDHELADDELQWMKSVYADFSKSRAAAGPEFDPKEGLRAILARAEYRLSAAPVYYCPLGPAADHAMDDAFARLTAGAAVTPEKFHSASAFMCIPMCGFPWRRVAVPLS